MVGRKISAIQFRSLGCALLGGQVDELHARGGHCTVRLSLASDCVVSPATVISLRSYQATSVMEKIASLGRHPDALRKSPQFSPVVTVAPRWKRSVDFLKDPSVSS